MQSPAPPQFRYRFGSAEFDESRFELRVGGATVDVQRKPLEILALLLARAGEVITKDELLDEVWEGRPTVENVIANAIAKLRGALGDENAGRIVTLPRVGYRFDGTLERIAVGHGPASALELETGTVVPGRPHFRLEARLGSSPAGEVWLARHAKTRERRVYKFCADGGGLPGLKREATLSRLLQEQLGLREDYARVLDWNFETPPFFLECEYGGVDLLQWSESEGHLAALTLAERISLFLQAADAVAAAHGVGVLHKDIKPANILVSAKGEGWQLRLTDFGSSRLLDPHRLAELGITRLGLTLTGDAAQAATGGTPLYLAPELIAGAPPTMASDVYALGVLLCQLVVGDLRRPLAPGWERSVPDALLCEDIAAATDGEVSRRYASVTELTTRLRALDARREERRQSDAAALVAQANLEALKRSRARRPWLIGAVVALALGVIASSLLWWHSENQRRLAQQQAARAEATVRFLSEDLLGAVSPGGSGFERDPTITELLNYASTGMEARLPKDPAVRGSIHLALGEALRVLGNMERSAAELRLAAADFAAAFGTSHETTLRARYSLVHTLAYARSAVEIREAESELRATDTLAGARLSEDGELALASSVAHGILDFQQLRIEPALEAWREADRLQRELHPEDAQLAVVIRHNLADSVLRQGKPEEAAVMLREVLADPLLDPARVGASRVASLRVILARALRNLGRYDEALPVAQAAASVTEKLSGPDDYQTLVQLSLVASIHDQAGHCPEALAILRTVRARMAARYGEERHATLVESGNLGMQEYACGDREAGLRLIGHAESGLRRLYGEDDVAAHSFRYSLARALTEQRRWREALEMSEGLDVKALAAGDSKPGWEHRLNALRGEILLGLGESAQGRALLERALPEMIAIGSGDAEEIRRLNSLLAAR